MQQKHLSGLKENLDAQIKSNKKEGGVSNALKRIKERPEGNYHANARFSVDKEKYEKGYDIIFNKNKKKKRNKL